MRAFDASEIAVLIETFFDEHCVLVALPSSADGSSAVHARNVKRCGAGQTVLRGVSAALHEASTHFRRARGYREPFALIGALARPDKETKKVA